MLLWLSLVLVTEAAKWEHARVKVYEHCVAVFACCLPGCTSLAGRSRTGLLQSTRRMTQWHREVISVVMHAGSVHGNDSWQLSEGELPTWLRSGISSQGKPGNQKGIGNLGISAHTFCYTLWPPFVPLCEWKIPHWWQVNIEGCTLFCS